MTDVVRVVSPLFTWQGIALLAVLVIVALYNLVIIVLLSRRSFRERFSTNRKLSLPILAGMLIGDIAVVVLAVGGLLRVIRV